RMWSYYCPFIFSERNGHKQSVIYRDIDILKDQFREQAAGAECHGKILWGSSGDVLDELWYTRLLPHG
ncbi:hypothetical protein ACJX0J_016133, partial [Zea mays]